MVSNEIFAARSILTAIETHLEWHKREMLTMKECWEGQAKEAESEKEKYPWTYESTVARYKGRVASYNDEIERFEKLDGYIKDIIKQVRESLDSSCEKVERIESELIDEIEAIFEVQEQEEDLFEEEEEIC